MQQLSSRNVFLARGDDCVRKMYGRNVLLGRWGIGLWHMCKRNLFFRWGKHVHAMPTECDDSLSTRVVLFEQLRQQQQRYRDCMSLGRLLSVFEYVLSQSMSCRQLLPFPWRHRIYYLPSWSLLSIGVHQLHNVPSGSVLSSRRRGGANSMHSWQLLPIQWREQCHGVPSWSLLSILVHVQLHGVPSGSVLSWIEYDQLYFMSGQPILPSPSNGRAQCVPLWKLLPHSGDELCD